MNEDHHLSYLKDNEECPYQLPSYPRHLGFISYCPAMLCVLLGGWEVENIFRQGVKYLTKTQKIKEISHLTSDHFLKKYFEKCCLIKSG